MMNLDEIRNLQDNKKFVYENFIHSKGKLVQKEEMESEEQSFKVFPLYNGFINFGISTENNEENKDDGDQLSMRRHSEPVKINESSTDLNAAHLILRKQSAPLPVNAISICIDNAAEEIIYKAKKNKMLQTKITSHGAFPSIENLEKHLSKSKTSSTIISNITDRRRQRRPAVSEKYICERILILRTLDNLMLRENISKLKCY